MNKALFVDYLLDKGVPLERWGSHANEKIERLAGDVGSGFASIVSDASGAFAVSFHIAKVCLLYKRVLFLAKAEDEAEFCGTIPKGFIGSIISSLSVPIQHGEGSYVAAGRAIRQFFFLPEDAVVRPVDRGYQTTGPRSLDTLYPGLNIVHSLYSFEWDVPEELYQCEGYHRRDSGRIVRYKWSVVVA